MRFLLVILLTTSAFAQPRAAGGDPQFLVRIPSARPAQLRQVMERLGYDVSCLPCGDGFVRAIVSRAEFAELHRAGLPPVIMESARPLRASPRRFGAGGWPVPSGYRDLAAITTELTNAAAAHPSLATVVDIAATYGPGATFEGRPILAIKISDNVGLDEDEPAALFVSAHHCREIVTPEIALELIQTLLNGYGSDPAITAAVDGHEIWIIPVMNPDGLEYVWSTNNLWRKNRKPIPTGEFGVDLNRNYPVGWDLSCGGSTNPASETFRGPAPASEEEIQSLLGLSRAQRFTKVIDFHSFAEEVRRGYQCAIMPAPIDQVSLAEAAPLAAAGSYQVAPSCCLGGHIHQQMAEHTAYTFLIETHTTFQPPYASCMTEVQTRAVPLCLTALARPVPLTGLVTDSVSGAPVAADIVVAGVDWELGESRRSDELHGRYRLWLPDGSWDVTIDAPGFTPLTQTVTVTGGATATLNATLSPSTAFAMEAFTTGWAAGDLRLGMRNVPVGTLHGYTLLSQATAQPHGAGVVLGLWPDLLTLQVLAAPPTPGGVFHWTAPVGSGMYPAATLAYPSGTFTHLVGTGLDVRGLALGPGFTLLGLTDLIRLQF